MQRHPLFGHFSKEFESRLVGAFLFGNLGALLFCMMTRSAGGEVVVQGAVVGALIGFAITPKICKIWRKLRGGLK